jgi:apolipoprotein N-acyltransferase
MAPGLSRHLPWAAPAASAVLLFLAFLPGSGGWAGFVWAIPLALWSATLPSWRSWSRGTALASAAAWLALLAWLRHVHPPLGWFGWALLSLYCAAYLWVWLAALRWVFATLGQRGAGDRILGCLGLAGLWVGLEALRGWALTGFGWLPLAASQFENTVMLAPCQVTGPLGPSAALILANLGLARWILRQFAERPAVGDPAPGGLLRGFTPELYVALLPVAGAFWLHIDAAAERPETVAVRVAAVQPDVDPNRKWDADGAAGLVRTLAELTREAGKGEPDLILWPEAAAPFPLDAPAYAAALRALSTETGSTLVLGAIERREGGYANSIAAIGPGGPIGPAYAKRRLVPFGEYVPGASWLPLRKVVPIAEDCLRGEDATPLLAPLRDGGTVALGALVCYEDIFPGLARDHALRGVQALVVLTNDAWYGRELGAWQHAAHSALLAASTRLPVLRCGNAGWSGILAPSGRGSPALSEGSIYFQGATDLGEIPLPARPRPTFWTLRGDWIVPPCLALAGLAALRRRRFLPRWRLSSS